MSGPEYVIVAVIALPMWIGGLVLWWVTMKQRRRPTSAAAPAGWHADPAGRHELRYWDGKRWSEHVSTGGQTSTDPLH